MNPQTDRTTWAYDDADRVTSVRLANGTRASYTYDDNNQVTRLASIKSSGATISRFDYSYDPVGNRARVVEANGDRVTWTYDNSYQLTHERRSGTNAYDITYTYDPVGIRLTKRDSGTRTTYTYDGANQVLTSQDSMGRTTYLYDNNGNQTRATAPGGGRTTYTWDIENRVTKVVLSSGTRNTFQYNGDGKRVRRDDSSGTAKLVWDNQAVLLETDASDATQVVYTYEPVAFGNLISQRRGGTTRFFHFDALGSADRLTDSGAIVSDNYVYQAFGSIKASSGTTVNAFRFVGRQGYVFDVDLLQYYLRARLYDPSAGRFLSCDPLGISSGANLYQYVANRVTNSTDPTGLCEVSSIRTEFAGRIDNRWCPPIVARFRG